MQDRAVPCPHPPECAARCAPRQGGGVFVNPVSASAPAKLRVLYEVLPLAFVVEAAGGASTHDGRASALELAAPRCDARAGFALGSPLQVDRARACMAAVTDTC